MKIKPSKMTNERWSRIINNPQTEQLVQLFAWLADEVKVREQGDNRGEYVDMFLKSADVAPGNPWCAAAVNWCCETLDLWTPPSGKALVKKWINEAIYRGRLWENPARGRLCAKDYGGGKGHIGVVIRSGLGLVYSIEGNTSPGDEGSQRDGQGLYRRVRRASFWDFYIDVTK